MRSMLMLGRTGGMPLKIRDSKIAFVGILEAMLCTVVKYLQIL